MHIVLIVWHADEAVVAAARRALPAILRNHPTLDAATAWEERGADGGWTAFGVHHAHAALGARQVRWSDGRHTVFQDGTPVDPSGAIAGHRAEAIAGAFDRATTALEGRFLIGRLDRAAGVELIVDPLGMCPLYRAQCGRTIAYSNSVEWLRRALDLAALDRTGAALLLARGWVGSDRTLIEGIRAVPGGAHIRLDPAAAPGGGGNRACATSIHARSAWVASPANRSTTRSRKPPPSCPAWLAPRR